MANNGETLTERQKKTIEALCSYRNIGTALEAAKVGRSTLARWLKQPVFNAALAQAQRAALAGLSRSLVVLADKATAALEAAFDDAEAPHPAKIRAADVTITNLLRVAELVDLEARITALEENQAAK